MEVAANPNDPTKRVLDWRRICVWTKRDMRTGATNMIILRCPADAKERLFSALGDGPTGRRELLRHPMLLHGVLGEYLTLDGTVFSKDFAAPLYGLVRSLQVFRVSIELTRICFRSSTWATPRPNSRRAPAGS